MQILSRLNVGGTASHVIYVTRGLRDRGHEVILISGREDPDEGNMLSLAEENRVEPILIECFRRRSLHYSIWPLSGQIWRLLRKLKPHVVHTHASKAGVLGRIAAILAGVPIRIHTFHGHVLQEYFSPRVSKVFIRIERILARRSAAIIGVSREVCDQLVKMGVVDRQRVRHIGIGLELDQYLECDRYQGVLKAELVFQTKSLWWELLPGWFL